MYDAASNQAPTPTYETADAAINQMLAQGWDRDNYDPVYPFCLVWNEGDAMRARVVFDDYRQAYIIEGVRI